MGTRARARNDISALTLSPKLKISHGGPHPHPHSRYLAPLEFQSAGLSFFADSSKTALSTPAADMGIYTRQGGPTEGLLR
jgi:hypothetical protein